MEETGAPKTEKGESKGKGRETLFRVAYKNQIALIRIADNKANLIISINAMIISTIIAVSGYGIFADRMQYDKVTIIVPVTLILLSCLTSAIFAIQAAKPKLIKATILDPEPGKSSLLFFGVISDLSQKEYLHRMNTLLTSDKDIYDTLTIDLHNQGIILNRKYALLNRAYRIFMFGFILSVWAFLAFLVVG